MESSFTSKRQMREEIEKELQIVWKSMDEAFEEAQAKYREFLSLNALLHPIRWWKASNEHHRLSERHHELYLKSQTLLSKYNRVI